MSLINCFYAFNGHIVFDKQIAPSFHDSQCKTSAKTDTIRENAVSPPAQKIKITFLLLDGFRQMNMEKKHNKKCSLFF